MDKSCGEKAQAGFYKTKLKYPEKRPVAPEDKDILAYLKSKSGAKYTYKQAQQKLQQAYEISLSSYETALKAYNDDSSRLSKLFVQDLYREYGVDNADINAIIYALAYDRGHHAGFGEISIHFQDMIAPWHDFLRTNTVVRKARCGN